MEFKNPVVWMAWERDYDDFGVVSIHSTKEGATAAAHAYLGSKDWPDERKINNWEDGFCINCGDWEAVGVKQHKVLP